MTYSRAKNERINSDFKLLKKSDLSVAVGLFFLFLVVYLTWQTRLYNNDALVSSWRISTSDPIDNFYPHHLIYLPLSFGIHNLVRMISGNNLPVYSLQAVNSLFGAITIGLAYCFAVRIVRERVMAVLIALVMGFSFTFWHFSTDAAPYILVNLLIMFALYLLHSWNGRSTGRLVGAAVLFCIAILIHQMALLMLIPALLLTYTIQSGLPGRFGKVMFFLLSVLVPVFVGYILVSELVYARSGFGSGLRFFFFHGSNPDNWIFLRDGFPKYLPAYIYHGILGHYALFVFSAGPGRYAVFNTHPVPIFEDGNLTRYVFPVLFMLFSLIMLLRSLILVFREKHPNMIFLSSWVIPLFIFLLLWNPGYSFHRIFYLFPFLLIVTLNMRELTHRYPGWRKRFLYSQIILIVFLIIYNASLAIIPQSRSISEYKEATALKSILSAGDLVIMSPDEEYLSRMIRCFTLSERMITGEFPKAVPALGRKKMLEFEEINEENLSEFFKRIYISKAVHEKWSESKLVTITFRLADDLETRKIMLNFGHWEVEQVKVMESGSMMEIFRLRQKDRKTEQNLTESDRYT